MKYSELKLTYGFELEGRFATSLVNRLKYLGGTFAGDGSVHCMFPEKKKSTWDIDESVSEYKEYRSPVFTSIDALVKHLKYIYLTKNKYHANRTCGLHVHIGEANGNYTELAELTFAPRLLNDLQAFASALDIRQKNRFNNRYCRPYSHNSATNSSVIKSQGKYYMIRNHPANRLEMRFLTPVPVKTPENTRKILSHFLELLKREARGQTVKQNQVFAPNKTKKLYKQTGKNYHLNLIQKQVVKNFITSTELNNIYNLCAL